MCPMHESGKCEGKVKAFVQECSSQSAAVCCGSQYHTGQYNDTRTVSTLPVSPANLVASGLHCKVLRVMLNEERWPALLAPLVYYGTSNHHEQIITRRAQRTSSLNLNKIPISKCRQRATYMLALDRSTHKRARTHVLGLNPWTTTTGTDASLG